MEKENKLDRARKIINETDKMMAELFLQRMEAVKAVAEHKKEEGLQIEDKLREEALVAKNLEYIPSEEMKSHYVNFIRSTMEISKNYQHSLLKGMKVAYSGVPGAFANIAAEKIFPDAMTVPYGDFKSAYDAVVRGECECAVLPIENSHNGDVGQVMDLTFFGSLHINGVYDISVVQNLLVVPGTKLEDIKTVVSHPQALGQCQDYIRKHGFETLEEVNTAVAVKKVAELGRYDIAAIGSEEAGAKYGLQKLEAHINGGNGNTTRFAVFSSVPHKTEHDNHFIMLFTVPNEAGCLGRAVNSIGEHGFNLRALKSRPTKELIWSYYFFVEGEGNLDSTNGKRMLKELEEICMTVKIAGRFEKEMAL